MKLYENHFQIVNAILCFAFAIAVLVIGEHYRHLTIHILDGIRQSLFSSLGGATLALLGLVVTANTILLSIPEQSLERFHASGNFLRIHSIFGKTSLLLILCSVFFFCLLVFDKDITVKVVHSASSMGSACRFVYYGLVLLGSLTIISVLESIYCLNALGMMLLTKRKEAALTRLTVTPKGQK